MTAEVGILNRMGVALAADSAVTIGTRYTQKVYNSANKLFSLSKHHPVGIMIYGSANFMGVPWEIIIKSFRKYLGETKFETLKEYSDAFFQYITHDEYLLQQYVPSAQVQRVFNSYLTEVLNKVNEELSKSFVKNLPAEEDVEKEINNIVDKTLEALDKMPLLEGFTESFKDEFIYSHEDDIQFIVENNIYIDLDTSTYIKILEMAAEMFSKEVLSDLVSGVVISGYGENELFPSMFEFETEGMFCDRIKLVKKVHTVIAAEPDEKHTTASIRAFAQKEMVQMFMHGIDPKMFDAINDALIESLVNMYPEAVNHVLDKKLSDDQMGDLRELGVNFINNYFEEIERLQLENFVYPIVDTVDLLPKEELAAMAEALVNLTSFKRKVTIDAETVGGPIDVAVITKGDGFIWIKRKHYFKPELNYQFFQKYMKGGDFDGNGDI